MRLVELATFYDAEEALVVIALIEAAGLSVFCPNMHHQCVAPQLKFALGGYTLFVVESDKHAIEGLLDESAAQSVDAPAPYGVCEQCDSRASRWRIYWLSFAIALFVAVPLVHTYRPQTCSKCGAKVRYCARGHSWHRWPIVLIGGAYYMPYLAQLVG